MSDPIPTYEEKSELDSSSVEKGSGSNDYVVTAGSHHHFDVHDLDQVQRKLKQRHVQMIAVSPRS